jgi:hypothetical protein
LTEDAKNHVHSVGSEMTPLVLVNNVTVPVELVLVQLWTIVPPVLFHYINLEPDVLTHVQVDNMPLLTVNALTITIVDVVKLVTPSVKPVSDLLMKNVLFVKLVTMLNQTPTNNVKPPVQKEPMLMMKPEPVSHVPVHVPLVLPQVLMETVLGVLLNMPSKVDIVITHVMMDIITNKVSVLNVTTIV